MNKNKVLISFMKKASVFTITYIAFIRISSGNNYLIPVKIIFLVIYIIYMKYLCGTLKNNTK